ncbi:Flp pilus assembly protein CpaB [Neogemmobacter tilapiae]|uniref:Flp pilus assembly protein CpaB n=1 Tax=Neogemmobacter tilapiae TaxID=875041 RepID=A0A918TI11_9RHOB|nr:Flp pilus assembly protein CpaB [Gemmobacter tilapiae]GHC49262.1 Flp pilus assembly protein CpaB [Gemmobacter tilapiae]
MRSVFGLVLVLGVALAGFAVYMVQGYLNQTQAEVQNLASERAKVGELVEVLAITKPLKFGEELKPEDVQKIYLQKAFLPDGVFIEVDALFPKDAKPRYIQRQLEKFEALTAVKVTEPGQAPGLRLSPGMRAFTIEVDAISGVSGFIKPDDRVDVFWSGTVGSEGKSITQSILFQLRVIAVDQSSNTDAVQATVARTVTVEVTSDQVAVLAQAQNTGSLRLSLAGTDAQAPDAPIITTTETMLGIVEAPVIEAAPVVAEEVCTTRERKGTEVVETPIDCATRQPLIP